MGEDDWLNASFKEPQRQIDDLEVWRIPKDSQGFPKDFGWSLDSANGGRKFFSPVKGGEKKIDVKKCFEIAKLVGNFLEKTTPLHFLLLGILMWLFLLLFEEEWQKNGFFKIKSCHVFFLREKYNIHMGVEPKIGVFTLQIIHFS